MPNWCENNIVLKGSEEDIAQLTHLIQAPVIVICEGMLDVLSYDQPPWEYGEEFKSDYEPGQQVMSRTLGNVVDKSKLSYQEMVDRLGTKWDFNLDAFSIADTEISGYANTAWSPPIGWFRLICTKFNLSGDLVFGEQGNDFGGIVTIGGGLLQEYSSDYNNWGCLTHECSSEFLDYLLDLEDDYEEYIAKIKSEAKLWPKSWDEYKSRYHISTTQI